MVKFIKSRLLSTQEMEDIGWLLRPTAKEQYLGSSKLQAGDATYDDYLHHAYEYLKNRWSSGTAAPITTNTGGSGGLSGDIIDPTTTSLAYDTNYSLGKYSIPIDTVEKEETSFTITEDIKNFTIENTSEIQKVKAKGIKKGKTYRITNKVCPSCMSTLKLTELGIWECTQDRLKLWEKEFVKFSQLSVVLQQEHLINFSHPDKFVELYEKWSFKDDLGLRSRFECDYSNKLFNPISRFRTIIPDPALVRTIECSLGRKLTNEEKIGEIEIWREGRSYFDTYKKGRYKVKIPQLTFPDSFM